ACVLASFPALGDPGCTPDTTSTTARPARSIRVTHVLMAILRRSDQLFPGGRREGERACAGACRIARAIVFVRHDDRLPLSGLLFPLPWNSLLRNQQRDRQPIRAGQLSC